jgi:hypothetical protein
MAATTLLPNQQVAVTLSGVDVGGNPAPVTLTSFTVDNHAIIYALGNADNSTIPGNEILVVARGPVGTATLTVNANDANGNALPPQAMQFSVESTGTAVSLVLTVGTPATQTLNTPAAPSGW